jgi:hypothetical protein
MNLSLSCVHCSSRRTNNERNPFRPSVNRALNKRIVSSMPHTSHENMFNRIRSTDVCEYNDDEHGKSTYTHDRMHSRGSMHFARLPHALRYGNTSPSNRRSSDIPREYFECCQKYLYLFVCFQ